MVLFVLPHTIFEVLEYIDLGANGTL